MTHADEFIQMYETYGAHNYHPLPVVLARGAGARVWDMGGKEYIDFLSCYGALNFGHQHPILVSTLKNQIDRLAVCSRAFYSEELSLFCKELAEFCAMGAVLPMNSGAEAVESAVKIARKWGYEKKGIASDRARIIAMENNFHGRTLSLISFSTEPHYRKNFGPFTPGFDMVPFGDAGKLEATIDTHTVAVLLEPIQAEAGIIVPPPGYLSLVREICDRNNVLLLADEIQTGLGRTGLDFCFQHENIQPDILILGKALGGGLLPISAVVAARTLMDVLVPGTHGSTFGGNPLACAVARESLRVLKQERLSIRAAILGELMLKALQAKRLPRVKSVRGKGCLVGIELDSQAGGARRYCERLAVMGVLCKETHEHVIRIAPPLIIPEQDLLDGIQKIIEVIQSG